jgi:hypothetical protein
LGDAGSKEWKQYDKTRDRSRNTDIEERAASKNGRFDPDERSERTQQKRGRQEKRQRCVDTRSSARDVVAQFVRQQDGKQRQREQEPAQYRGISLNQ